jgi:hypothetical protein
VQIALVHLTVSLVRFCAGGDLGFTLTKHITANAGYQLGTRLNVNVTSNRIGLDLTQKGPVVGLEFSF